MMQRLAIAAVLTILPTLSQGQSQGRAPSDPRNFTVVMRDLTVHQGAITVLDGRVVSLKGRNGTTELARADVLAFFDEGGAFHNLAAIELTSGARHAGNVSAREPDDDHVRWITSFMDELSIPLGEVRSIILVPGTPANGTADEDALTLTNGDIASGFVVGVSSKVTVSLDSGDSTVPIERVARIDLAQTGERGAGEFVWLSDGSIVPCSDLRIDAERVRFTSLATNSNGNLMRAQCRGAALSAESFVPLIDLERIERPVGGETLDVPLEIDGSRLTPLGAGSILLPRPARYEWRLPEGASRFGARLTLEDPEAVWGDCEVVITLDGSAQPIARVRLHPGAQTAEVRADITPGAGVISITIEQGPSGPVMDRVRLSRAIVTIEQ